MCLGRGRARARRRAQRDGNFTDRPPAGEPGACTVGSTPTSRPLTGRHLQGPPSTMTDDPQRPRPHRSRPRRPSATRSPHRTTPRPRRCRPGDAAAPLHPAGWSAPTAPAAGSYSPTPESRPEWMRPVRDARADLARALVRARSRAGAGQPGRDPEACRRRAPVVAAALLSAVLASGGTVVALGAAGALDRSAPAAAVGLGHERRRGQARDDRRVLGDDRRRGQGQPGRRADHRHGQHRTPATSASSPRAASARASSTTATAGS